MQLLKSIKKYSFVFFIPKERLVKIFFLILSFMQKTHLTKEQRYTISAMYKQKNPDGSKKYKQNDIAAAISKDKSVVSREVRRNKNPKTGNYSFSYAQDMSDVRKERLRLPKKLTSFLKRTIIAMLLEGLSPEQISGRLQKEGKPTVSYETIYKWIPADKMAGGDLYKLCRHQLKKRKRIVYKSQAITGKSSIEQRPGIVNHRGRFGDCEMDLIIDKEHKNAILTFTERSTNFGLIRKLKYGKNSKELAKTAIEILLPFKEFVHTITIDNGTEFACHKEISEALDAVIYFTHPYSAWEKGTIENMNKLVRQYIPKGSNFNDFDDYKLKEIQDKINKRPRKKLKYYSPKEYFDYITKKIKLHL
jgi:IS30 family transposase